MSCHSEAFPGLQNHSVGEIYPWTITRVGDQFEQPLHCLTGRKGPEFLLGTTKNGQSAYKQAELWCKQDLGIEPGRDAEPEPTILGREYTFLVPIRYNSTRLPIAKYHWNWLETELVALFGGYTRGANVNGVWFDADGQRVEDDSWSYKIACPVESREKLVKLLQTVKRKLDQEAIYLSQSAVRVELV